MEKKLHILNLEDDQDDAELNKETLEREGLACEMIRVETRQDFLRAIEQDGVDIILADYTLGIGVVVYELPEESPIDF